MRWLPLALGTLVVVALVVTAAGAALPRAHVASRAITVPVPPERVWEALTDVAAFPRWRGDVTAVELLPARDGRPAWRESSRHGRITFELVSAERPRRLTTVIADRDLPFGGSWDYALARQGSGTRVVVTERGEVHNPLFRFLSRYVFGHTATIDAYLTALGRHFGAEVTPEPSHGA